MLKFVTEQGFGFFALILIAAAILLLLFALFGRPSSAGSMRPMVDSGEFPALEHNQRVALCTQGKFGDLFIDTEKECLYTTVNVEHMGTMRLEFPLTDYFSFDFVPASARPQDSAKLGTRKHLRREVLMDLMEKVAALGHAWEKCWPAIHATMLREGQERNWEVAPTAQNSTLSFSIPTAVQHGEAENWSVGWYMEPLEAGLDIEFSLDGEIHSVFGFF